MHKINAGLRLRCFLTSAFHATSLLSDLPGTARRGLDKSYYGSGTSRATQCFPCQLNVHLLHIQVLQFQFRSKSTVVTLNDT